MSEPGKKLSGPMILLIVSSMLLALLIVSAVIPWMPTQASTYAGDVDWLYYFIYWVSVFFTLLIAGTLVFFVLFYRQTDKAKLAPGKMTHSTALELTWTIIPIFIVLAIFAFGFKQFINMSVAPAQRYEIVATGWQWAWSFTYPNGYADTNLHIRADQPTRLILKSNDVIHSLFIKQFRAKKDVVPGRYNDMWFEAPWSDDYPDENKTTLTYTLKDGTTVTEDVLVFDLYCTEYCGVGHSQMNRKVYVHRTQEDFDFWLAEASRWIDKMSPVDAGQRLWDLNCKTCHSVDGTNGTGPTWQNIWNRKAAFTDGTVWSDHYDSFEQYIRESIYEPQKHIVASHSGGNMASFQGQIDEQGLFAMVQYMKSLSPDTYEGAALPTSWDETEFAPKKEGEGEGENGGEAGGDAAPTTPDAGSTDTPAPPPAP